MASTGTIIIMGAIALLTAAVPIGIMIFLRKKGGRWKDFFVGAGTFFLFALVLEQLLHRAVLYGPLGPTIQGSIWLTALYGALAAGIFEETGRFAAFKLLLRNRRDPIAALSYGIGHSGCEAFLILGVTYITNIVLLVGADSGGSLPEGLAALAELASAPASLLLWAGFERLTAIAFHMACSVLVFTAAVRPGKLWLFPAAVAAHFAFDFLALACNAHLPIAATELVIAAFALAMVFAAARVYKNLQQNTENT